MLFLAQALIVPGALACAPADQVAQRLADRYREQLVQELEHEEGGTVEFWQNLGTGTYTVIIKRDDQRCLMEAGTIPTPGVDA